MIILEAGDTSLIILQTFLAVDQKQDSDYSMERKATYAFKKDEQGNGYVRLIILMEQI